MLTLKAPAKINWFLRVYGLRNDGYHEIKSLIQKISLYDVLTFVSSTDLTLVTDLQIPIKQNLVYKAATLLKKESGINAGAEICLYKNIPVAAGLGGGSSDAALTLKGLNELWSLGLSNDELYVFAKQLGSDVPFFLHGPLAFVKGRGEKVTTFKAIKSFDILLIKPPVTVSTHWAYKNLAASFHTHHCVPNKNLKKLTNKADKVNNIEHFIHAIARAELYKNSNIPNDIESVIIKSFPVITDIKRRLLGEGAIFSMMSGSGPTVFGVFGSAKEAKNASKVFRDCWTAVVHTITEEN